MSRRALDRSWQRRFTRRGSFSVRGVAHPCFDLSGQFWSNSRFRRWRYLRLNGRDLSSRWSVGRTHTDGLTVWRTRFPGALWQKRLFSFLKREYTQKRIFYVLLTGTHFFNKRQVAPHVAFVKIGHLLRFTLHPGHQGLNRRSEGLPVHPQLSQVGPGMAGECLSILKIKSAQITSGIEACERVEDKRYDTGLNV